MLGDILGVLCAITVTIASIALISEAVEVCLSRGFAYAFRDRSEVFGRLVLPLAAAFVSVQFLYRVI